MGVEGHSYHLFVVKTSRRNELQKYLANNGIASLIHYPFAMNQHETYTKLSNSKMPIAEKITDEILSLPISPVIIDDGMKYITKKINEWK